MKLSSQPREPIFLTDSSFQQPVVEQCAVRVVQPGIIYKREIYVLDVRKGGN